MFIASYWALRQALGIHEDGLSPPWRRHGVVGGRPAREGQRDRRGPQSREDEVSGRRSSEGRFEERAGVAQVPRSRDKLPGEERRVGVQL